MQCLCVHILLTEKVLIIVCIIEGCNAHVLVLVLLVLNWVNPHCASICEELYFVQYLCTLTCPLFGLIWCRFCLFGYATTVFRN